MTGCADTSDMGIGSTLTARLILDHSPVVTNKVRFWLDLVFLSGDAELFRKIDRFIHCSSCPPNVAPLKITV